MGTAWWGRQAALGSTAVPNDELESRVTNLEQEVLQLREQVALASSDSAAARVLAAGADHDVSEVRAELRAHTQVLNALRETQLELRETQLEQGRELAGLRRDLGAHGEELAGLRREMHEGFAALDIRLAELTALFTRVTEAGHGH